MFMTATLYSLIEKAKANPLNPNEYLVYLFERLPAAITQKELHALLPWNVRLAQIDS